MDGKAQPQQSSNDWSDPFNAGQMMGMLVMLTFIEKNQGITKDVLAQLKLTTATNLETYLNKPSEDIYLMVDPLVEKVQNL